MRYQYSVVAALYTATACIHSQGADPVALAMDAQVNVMGGCEEVSYSRSLAEPLFPNVRFIVGGCYPEHGPVFEKLVAVDHSGLVYVLDSPSSYRFFVAMHPPGLLDSAAVIRFAHLALVMMGELSPTDTLDSTTSLSESVFADSGYKVTVGTRSDFRETLTDVTVRLPHGNVRSGGRAYREAVAKTRADSI